jgi:kinesin family member 2/24
MQPCANARLKSGKPPVNPQWLAPHENGTQLCRLRQDDFVTRALRTAGVKPEQAKALYFKLWSLHIDSRTLLTKSAANGTSEAAIVGTAKTTNSTTSQAQIKHGMFFKLSEEDAEDGVEMVMMMGPESETVPEDGERAYVCAAVCLADGAKASYELFVASQRVFKEAGLRDEIVMEYDSGTRCYHIKA